MMKRYEYIKLELDLEDLDQLNRYSEDGWRVVCIVCVRELSGFAVTLLERELP
jgi:hypothetical protein